MTTARGARPGQRPTMLALRHGDEASTKSGASALITACRLETDWASLLALEDELEASVLRIGAQVAREVSSWRAAVRSCFGRIVRDWIHLCGEELACVSRASPQLLALCYLRQSILERLAGLLVLLRSTESFLVEVRRGLAAFVHYQL